ncbi:MAG: glycosyltransferase [Wenzhouxiangella sp.]|nr:MAG: glycosyltransferase [Wenzhouxiangella sp.]
MLHWRAPNTRQPPDWLDRSAAAVLFASLALGLLLPKIAGAGFLLFSLAGIIWLSLSGGWRLRALAPLERLLLAAVLIYVTLWLAAWAWNGLDGAGRDGVGRTLRLLLIIPLLLFVRQLDRLEPAWWLGLTVGAVLAGVYAWWFHLSGQVSVHEHRVDGPTNPIYFGGIALAFAMMLLARVHDASLAAHERIWTVLAIMLAISASTLSGSRGAWLVLPLLLPVYLVTLGVEQRPLKRYLTALALVLVALIVMLNPMVPMSERAGEAASDLARLVQGEQAEGTLGRRVVMWQISWQLFLEHPLAGAGPGGFRQALESAIASGRAEPDFLAYRHPHSAYLSALNHGGLVGLLSLLLLFAYVVRHHVRVWHTGLRETRLLGWSGLAALSTLMVIALTESIFERNTGIVWFALFAAIPAGLIHARRRQVLYQPAPPRRHGLSVIIICKNEADRIGRCLESVAGWADEVIVLDSGSSDATVEIARRHTDSVHETDWPGYGRQKQRALEMARFDWVLSMDADEALDEELRREIDRVLAQPEPAHHGYALTWLTHAFGQTLSFGHWARTPLRLVMRERAHFTLAQVHEKIVMAPDSRIGLLEGPLHHRVFRDIEHARAKFDRYARLQAAERHQRGRRIHFPVTPWIRALLNFLDNYFLRTAFLDGKAGLTMSRLHAEYTLKKYRYLRELCVSET